MVPNNYLGTAPESGCADHNREDHMDVHLHIVVGMEPGQARDDEVAVRAANRVVAVDNQWVLGKFRLRVGLYPFERLFILPAMCGVVPVPPAPVAFVVFRISRCEVRKWHIGDLETRIARPFHHLFCLFDYPVGCHGLISYH